MKMRSSFTLAAGLGLSLLSAGAAASAQSTTQPATQPDAQPAGGATATTTTGPAGPRVGSVEVAATPADVRPGRPYIRVRSTPDAPRAAASTAPAPVQTAQPSASARRADGLIEVPLNTLGPGESLQQRSDRIAADNRRLLAEAEIAEREAERPNPRYEDGVNFIPYLRYQRFGVFAPSGFGQPLPRQNVGADELRLEDQLHGSALRVFSDASTSGTGTLGNLHQDAIRNAGQAATPPLIEQQRQRDQTQRNIQRATPRE